MVRPFGVLIRMSRPNRLPLHNYAERANEAGHILLKNLLSRNFHLCYNVQHVCGQSQWYDGNMAESRSTDATNVTQRLLVKANAGDDASREQLFRHCCERLERLARKMLADFPVVRRWEQTDDVFQNAAMRLMRSLRDVKPESVRHFYALAATQIRRELIDLARHYSGANGQARNLESAKHRTENDDRSGLAPADLTNAPDRLASWTELHAHIADLPEEEREVCELLWYQGLTQPDAAEVLDMPLRTLKRRWQKVRLKLHEVMNDQFS